MIKHKERHFVFLAGGRGERLWPLSRSRAPKQFLKLSSGTTLFDANYERIARFMGAGDTSMVVADSASCSTIKERWSDDIACYLEEPVQRNTAAAIALASLTLADTYSDDSVIFFLPADHVIRPEVNFHMALEKAYQSACSDERLYLVGVEPKHPTSEYGYIVPHQFRNDIAAVNEFREKPSEEDAEVLINKKSALWNTGIFVGKLKVFRDAFVRNNPELLGAVRQFLKGESEYSSVPALPFDKAVVEKLSSVAVVRGVFDWYDVGQLEQFIALADTSQDKSLVHSVSGSGNIAFSPNKVVVFSGVSDLCVVETEDVILVKRAGKSSDVRMAVNHLKIDKKSSVL